MYIDHTSITKYSLTNNKIYNSTGPAVTFAGSGSDGNIFVVGNEIENCGDSGLNIAGVSRPIIHNNIFKNCNQDSNVSDAGAAIWTQSSSYGIELVNNTFIRTDGKMTFPLANNNTQLTYKDIISGNNVIGFAYAALYNRMGYSAMPTTGIDWVFGDIVWNKSPLVGQALGWRCVQNLTTALTGAEATGQTVLTLDSVSGLTTNHKIGILLDSGSYHFSYITVIAGSDVTINDALPSDAAAGNAVYCFRFGTMANLS